MLRPRDILLLVDNCEHLVGAARSMVEDLLAAGPGADAYQIKRRTYFLGREIRFSGWQHDRVVRFFRRDSARYPNRRVHADMQTRKPAKVLVTNEESDFYTIVDVTANDGNGGTTAQSLSVTVTAANDNVPVFTSSSTPSVPKVRRLLSDAFGSALPS